MSDNFAEAWMRHYAAEFADAADDLGELDRKAGDGDFALNMGSAMRKMTAALDDDATDAFAAASEAFLDTGGTSGPLLGMWFRELSRSAGQHCDAETITTGLEQGLAVVQRLGGAEAGDKTMVDAMIPAASAMRAAFDEGADLADCLRRSAEAAQQGADETASMDAVRGRASYVGDAASGLVDPGAVSIALIMRCGAETAAS